MNLPANGTLGHCTSSKLQQLDDPGSTGQLDLTAFVLWLDLTAFVLSATVLQVNLAG